MKKQITQIFPILGIVGLLIFAPSYKLRNGTIVAEKYNENAFSNNSPQPVLASGFGVPVSGVVREVKRLDEGLVISIREIKGGVVTELNISIERIKVYLASGAPQSSDTFLKHKIGKRVRFYESGSFYGFPFGFWDGDRSPIATQG